MTQSRLVKLFFESPLDLLVIAVPVAAALRFVPGWDHPTLLFFVSSAAVVPLAGWMGRATDRLAERTSSGMGALLNASFGNVAELIIALLALSRGLTEVVKASITGSIIGNILLVFGASAFLGGTRHKKQKFNATVARASATSLSLAAVALIIPTVFHIAADNAPTGWTRASEQRLSLVIAILLFLTYCASLVFSLVTHRGLFNPDKKPETAKSTKAEPLWPSLVMLAVATALVTLMAESLVGAIETAREALGLTEVFVGVVIVAIIGNAAEHFTAIQAALKNKMDLSLGVTIGSSIQVALFVTPVLVFASYAFPHQLSLEFTVPEIAAVALAVWIVEQISSDGETNWLEGAQLICVYLVLGVLFFFLPAKAQSSSAPDTGIAVRHG